MMGKKYTDRDIKLIAEKLRNCKALGSPAHILTGAGCSISANIPGAAKIISDIREFIPERCEGIAEKGDNAYGIHMDLLDPPERRQLFDRYFAKSRINWAHIALAAMMKEGYVERVLTLNFDNILARACGLTGLYPAIYDFATAPTEQLELISSPAIVHLHGQGHGITILNTVEETERHKQRISPVISNSLLNRTTMVLGYSGEADGLFDIFETHYTDYQRLYWGSYSDSPAPFLTNWASKKQRATLLGGCGADRFLIDLAQALGCWPPDIFIKPYKHLLDEITPVAKFPVTEKDSHDRLASLRDELQEKIDAEVAPTGKVRTLLMNGQYEEAIRVVEDENFREQDGVRKKLAHDAYFSKANSVVLAKPDNSEFSDEDAHEACECYEIACGLDPGNHHAFFNWGILLNKRAMRTEDTSLRDTFLDQAEDNYSKATKIKDDDYEALNNWGALLYERAMRAENSDTRNTLFDRAEDKYRKAVEIKKDSHEAFYNLAILLQEKANKADIPSIRDALFDKAEEKYRKAIEIKEDKQEVFINWGILLHDRGVRAEGSDMRDSFFDRAEEKYRKAIEIKEDDNEPFNNWGILLKERAMKADDPSMRDTLFDRAEEKYRKAIALSGNNHSTFTNWSNLLLARYHASSDTAFKSRLLEQTEEIVLKHQKLAPEDSYNLACVYALQGRNKDCRAALENAETHSTLPSTKHLLDDKDMEPVHEKKWFKELLERLRAKESA